MSRNEVVALRYSPSLLGALFVSVLKIIYRRQYMRMLTRACDTEQVWNSDEELPPVLRRSALRRRQALRHGSRPRRRRAYHLLPRVEGGRLHLGAVHVLQLRRVAALQRLSATASPSPSAASRAAAAVLASQHASHGDRSTDRLGRVAADSAVHAIVARPVDQRRQRRIIEA